MSDAAKPQQPTDGDAAASEKPKTRKEAKSKKGPPTEEEIQAIRAARAVKKEREALAKQQAKLEAQKGPKHLDAEGRRIFVPREWGRVKGSEESRGRRRIRIGSWNILAQGLVRRKLFPGSDALRWKDREAGLKAEMLAHSFDVAALQEVDRLDAHGPNLEEAGYAYVYDKGYSAKQHGLMIAWKKAVFEEKPVGKRLLFFDQLAVDEDGAQGSAKPRLALSRVTRNIGSLVALRFVDAKPGEAQGIIVGTTHTWWHPQFGYERSRQAGLLVRELRRWQAQEEAEWYSWPAFVAGDFNDQPHSATYHLLTGRELTQHCRTEIAESSVVHQSVDEKRASLEAAAIAAAAGEEASGPQNGKADGAAPAPSEREDDAGEDDEEGEEEEEEEDEEEEGGQPDDRLRKNCRRPTTSDALLSVEELRALHSGQGQGSIRSAYALAYDKLEPAEVDNFFGSPSRGKERHDDEDWTRSEHQGFDVPEPMWTIFSPLFHLTLDYVFLLPLPLVNSSGAGRTAEPRYPSVTALLRTHKTEVLEEGGGLPRKGLCCSDHVAVGAEIEL